MLSIVKTGFWVFAGMEGVGSMVLGDLARGVCGGLEEGAAEKGVGKEQRRKFREGKQVVGGAQNYV